MERFRFLIVPELNLDGIAQGHWRTNAGLKDLNRDWGPFEQPETRAVRNALFDLIEVGARPMLLLDFHATRRTVLYTPPDDADCFRQISPGNGLRPMPGMMP
jgi:predicted deacylase